MLRRSKIRKAFIEVWLEDKEIEMDLRELVNMLGQKKIGRQDQRRPCGQVDEFARGEEIAICLCNGRIVMRTGVEIAEIRGRAESDMRSRMGEDGGPSRIIDGR